MKKTTEELKKELETLAGEIRKLQGQAQLVNQQLMEKDREAFRIKSIIDYNEQK